MSYEDQVFAQAIKSVTESRCQIQETAEDIRRAISVACVLCPPLYLMLELFDTGILGENLTNIYRQVDEMLDAPGSPQALRAVGDAWSTAVGGVAGELSGLLRKEVLETDNQWQGRAADAYAEAVTLMGEALSSIKDIAYTLQESLTDIASALTNFWTNMAAMLASCLVTLVTAAISCLVIMNIPGVVSFLCAFLAAFVNFFTQARRELTTLITLAQQRQGQLLRNVSGHKPFVRGLWPAAVTEKMADASVLDGDGSDWLPK